MGLKKLLNKLGEMLDAESIKRNKHRKKLKNLLKELKRKEVEIGEKLESEESDRKRDRLQKELEIIHSQRKKGVEMLRQHSN